MNKILKEAGNGIFTNELAVIFGRTKRRVDEKNKKIKLKNSDVVYVALVLYTL
jgi:hypothetical protein